MVATLTPAASSARGTRGSMQEWRFAARLARREVRRRPGRTALVVLLIAVPVIAMTMASVWARTESGSDSFRRSYGEADAAVWFQAAEMFPSESTFDQTAEVDAADIPDTSDLLAVLPPGSRVVEYGEAYVAVSSGAGSEYVLFTDLPVDDPITAGIVELQRGRLPTEAGEVLVSANVARKLGLTLGADERLTMPDETFTVVGIGRLERDFGQGLVIAPGFDSSVLEANQSWNRQGLIDVPPGSEVEGVGPFSYSLPGIDVSSVSGEQLAWGWVAGALALAVFGIVVTAAFATGARRQLVTLGQLSANGAPQRVLRRMQWLQGAWSGLVGSAFGVALGIGLLLAGRPLLARMASRDIDSYRLGAADLIVIVLTGTVAAAIAAGLPARSIARVPTLAALAGRRPLAEVPRRLVPLGAAAFGLGVAFVTVAAAAARDGSDGNGTAALAVFGGVLVLGGACCLSPVLIGALGPVGDAIGGSLRLAARSLVRTRTRSAAVVAAICATAAFALGASMAAASADASRYVDSGLYDLPTDVVSIQTYDRAAAPGDVERLEAAAERVLGAIEWTDVRGIVSSEQVPINVTIADDALLETIGLSPADSARLQEAGRLGIGFTSVPEMDASGFGIADSGPLSGTWPAALDPRRSMGGTLGLIVTESFARQSGLPIETIGRLGQLDAPVTQGQAEALNEATNIDTWNPFVPQAVPRWDDSRFSDVFLSWRWPDSSVSPGWVVPAIAGVALLVTLLVVAIGLSLSAAESRDERDVLLAVGARPRTMRRLAAHKAVLLAAAGCVLAVPIGLVPVWAVIASGTQERTAMPWAGLGLVVVVIPAVAGLAAWLGSTVSQIVRPTRMSTLATD